MKGGDQFGIYSIDPLRDSNWKTEATMNTQRTDFGKCQEQLLIWTLSKTSLSLSPLDTGLLIINLELSSNVKIILTQISGLSWYNKRSSRWNTCWLLFLASVRIGPRIWIFGGKTFLGQKTEGSAIERFDIWENDSSKLTSKMVTVFWWQKPMSTKLKKSFRDENFSSIVDASRCFRRSCNTAATIFHRTKADWSSVCEEAAANNN